MAPIPSSFTLQRRQIVQPPGATPVSSTIDLKTFWLLFLCSFCIFFLAVVYWKCGAFIRIFSRGKVTGGGPEATVRYAKTWHGWVPLEIHNEKKARRRARIDWIRDKLGWRAPHSDYNWVWWDPGGQLSNRRSQDRRRRRMHWIPSRLMKYAINGLDPIPSEHSAPQEQPSSNTLLSAPTVKLPLNHCQLPELSPIEDDRFVMSPAWWPGLSTANKWADRFSPINPNGGLPPQSPDRNPKPKRILSRSVDEIDHRMVHGNRPTPPHAVRRTASDGQQVERPPLIFTVSNNQPPWSRKRIAQSSFYSEEHWICDFDPAKKTVSWRYRAWGARMQCQAIDCDLLRFRGCHGRAGTPITEALRSMISSGSGFCSRASNAQTVTIQDVGLVNSKPVAKNDIHSPREKGKEGLRILKSRGIQGRPPLWNVLSNPEVRLGDDLTRKLEWLSCEVDPGRKPFHFPILHNHWLNRRTWVVLDPSARATTETKMHFGDPRFRRSIATQGKVAKRGSATAQRPIKICPPRLDSWRRAMNGVRVVSGIQEIPRATGTNVGSADDAPPGEIDPSSWMLKRPPQGFEMSRKQKNGYFEGAGGWFEKLEYWQRVPRAYRARRVILEGRANRQRLSEIVGVGRKALRRRTVPSNRVGGISEKYSQRKEKSGRGVIPRYHRHRQSHHKVPSIQQPIQDTAVDQAGVQLLDPG